MSSSWHLNRLLVFRSNSWNKKRGAWKTYSQNGTYVLLSCNLFEDTWGFGKTNSSKLQFMFMTYLTTGVATSMLFSAFESWYVYEHTERKCFSAEWISATFSFTTLGNGLLAIASGVISNFVAEGKKFSFFWAVGKYPKSFEASIPKHQSGIWP